MLIEHEGKRPFIHETAYVAPNACLCGDVTIGANSRIMFGAQLIAEGCAVTIGENCIIRENAVIRPPKELPLAIGDHCLVCPHAHLTGCTIEKNVFLATGASIYQGALIMEGAEIRIYGVVQLKTVIENDQMLPIGWIAVGDPAQTFSRNRHEEIWNIQKKIPEAAYDIPERSDPGCLNEKICQVLSERLKAHQNDQVINKIN